MIGLYFGNLGKNFVFQNLGKIQKESNFTARSRQSRRDVENLAANSTRFEKPTYVMARSQRSRHDICWFLKHRGEVSTNLGEMEDISPRSRRDLESNKHHGEISARSLQSRRDLADLGEISPILGKNFARVIPWYHKT